MLVYAGGLEEMACSRCLWLKGATGWEERRAAFRGREWRGGRQETGKGERGRQRLEERRLKERQSGRGLFEKEGMEHSERQN